MSPGCALRYGRTERITSATSLGEHLQVVAGALEHDLLTIHGLVRKIFVHGDPQVAPGLRRPRVLRRGEHPDRVGPELPGDLLGSLGVGRVLRLDDL